jgi:hypothetical protein
MDGLGGDTRHVVHVVDRYLRRLIRAGDEVLDRFDLFPELSDGPATGASGISLGKRGPDPVPGV